MIDSEDDIKLAHIRPAFVSGTIVFEKFRVMDVLGEGGVGRVYRAKQTDLDRVVALKVLNSEIKDQRAIIRFQNEARATSRLSHPNIAAIHNFGVSKDGEPFMAMEYVDGMSLRQLLSLNGRLPIDECLSISCQICDALEHAHQKGLVHRDVKPGNIMIVTDEKEQSIVKVLDFGVAKDFTVEESAGGFITDPDAVVGSPLYMSPEQTMGQKVTPTSDLYALGCLMFHCLSGRAPFESESMSVLEILLKHRQEQPPALVDSIQDTPISSRLSDLVLKLLSKKPEDRYQTALEVKQALLALDEELAQHEARPAIKQSDEVLDKLPPPRKSRTILLATICGIVLVVVSIAVFVISKPPVLTPELAYDDKGAKDLIHKDLEKFNNKPSRFTFQSGQQVNDEYVRTLPTHLTMVSLGESQVTDEGLKALQNFDKLNMLDLYGSKQIKTLENLKSVKTIQTLGIDNTSVTDDCLKNIATLPELKKLSANETQLTTNGVLQLASIPTLVYLSVQNCPKISSADLEMLRQEMPNCRIPPAKTTLVEEAQDALKRADYAKAEQLLESTLKAVEKRPVFLNHFRSQVITASCLYSMACIHLGKTDKDMPRIQKALAIAQTTNYRDLVRVHDLMFGRALALKDISAAQKEAKVITEILVKNGARGGEVESNYLVRIGSFCRINNNFKSAESYLTKALKLRRQLKDDSEPPVYGPRGTKTLQVEAELGILYSMNSRWDKVPALLQHVIAYYPPKKDLAIDEAQLLAHSYIILTQVEINKKDFKKAETNINAAMQLCNNFPVYGDMKDTVKRVKAVLDKIARSKKN